MVNILWALIGLLSGSLINVLADDLPDRARPRTPHCPGCGHTYGPQQWLGIIRWFRGRACPACSLPGRQREITVELATAGIFFFLPWLVDPPADLVIKSLYIAVLILVIITDIEHRLILHVVTMPTTLFAFAASFVLENNSILLALVGAILGFALFFLAYLLGARLFGPGALGFGDVTLAAMMGAMVGLEVIFALMLGILLAGLFGIIGLVSGRLGRRSYFPYGPFLAAAGIVTVLWGTKILDWYIAR